MSKIPPELEAEMTPAVKAFVLALLERLDQAEAKIEKLTPRNSSMPPSTEHPHAKPKRKPTPGKKRQQGGQKGHKRNSRELIPVDQCSTVKPCHPNGCRRCGGKLQPDGADPKRHQVWDLPPIKPIIDEYQLFRGHCVCCGITTQASLPAGVPTGQCGPRLAAFTGLSWDTFAKANAGLRCSWEIC